MQVNNFPLYRNRFLLICMIHLIAYSQQGKNIDLKEVVNVASEIPKITIDSHDYSMRNRDEVLTEILRSTFWNENFKLNYKISIQIENIPIKVKAGYVSLLIISSLPNATFLKHSNPSVESCLI